MESESSESTFRDFFVKSFLVLPKPPKEMEDAKPLNDCTLASSFPTLTPTTSLEFSNYVFSSLTFGRTRTILAKWKLFISRELGEKKLVRSGFNFFPWLFASLSGISSAVQFGLQQTIFLRAKEYSTLKFSFPSIIM